MNSGIYAIKPNSKIFFNFRNRKEIEMVKKNIESIIIPCFCFAIEKTDDERKSKMNKLLELWEKNKYFSLSIIEVKL